MHIRTAVPFSEITTFKVGGTVRSHISAEPNEITEAIDYAQMKNLPLIPLGSGSNMLGVDGELKAVFLSIRDTHITELSPGVLSVGAGALWDDLVAYTVSRGWWGFENLSGIPGTVGGGIVQNIGAYNAVVGTCVSSVVAYDIGSRQFRTWTKDECAFGYRSSVFKCERDQHIITRVECTLSRNPAPNLDYRDLALFFSEREVSLAGIRDAVFEIRAKKFPPLTLYGTAGSFFLNPVVDAETATHLQRRFPELPLFTLPEGGVKVPLGWLFDHVLRVRGTIEDGVESWRAQALVLVAHPGAHAHAVRAFAKKISARAREELKIEIHPEVRLL